MSDAYRTVVKESQGELKDRGSKFIAYVFPIEDEQDFLQRLAELRAEHFKATHHCSAFRLRSGVKRSSDDGEPSGSAGKPMMNQLLSKELTDVGAISVRYYGGTKLGVSGLIAAYKGSVAVAIEAATIVTKYTTQVVEVAFDYAVMGTLMDCVKQLGLEIKGKRFDENPSLELLINQSEVPETILKIKAKLLGRAIEDVTDEDVIAGVRFIAESADY